MFLLWKFNYGAVQTKYLADLFELRIINIICHYEQCMLPFHWEPLQSDNNVTMKLLSTDKHRTTHCYHYIKFIFHSKLANWNKQSAP